MMPPRLNFAAASRSLALRARPSITAQKPIQARIASRRGFADEKDRATGPNQDQLPHVSEEAADMADVTGETKPDISQGTPVQEILERDEVSKEQAPQIIQEEMDNSKNTASNTTFANLLALGQMEAIANGGHASDVSSLGHKFNLPDLPLAPNSNLKHRYDPVVSQVTNLMMKDGKKSVAQRNMSYILNHLRTAPPPQTNSARPLLPGSPPPSHLPLNPILYLTLAIDSVAPLLRIRSQKGAAGGGAALQIPVPLGIKQRRRQAVQWILDAASKKKSRGSGRGQFAQKVADEIVAVVEGRSGVWDRRGLVHKTGTSARANLNFMTNRPRRL